ncbi:DUF2231 domain-containing protein [Gloeothece verrucosa]|uniref:DUF2231 domain-containing protein n=1 Tax=Gloeothece verrucosa (strain PCC 7822) TaxID=497965 RepID=E0UKS3_GLOV7|nr:DUF2231 domain-containing protein [Gloeothece verrucosa]ADN17553.1 Protein of unknown function DUF2231, transmembrane [Gloeothece verrucosa PCC 7822]
MNVLLIEQLGLKLGENRLPYPIPIHPNLVHLTLGLFIIGIAFDFAGTLFPLEKPILKLFSIEANPSGLFDAGWFNTLAAAFITFFTVAAGFFELVLANPAVTTKSDWGLPVETTMLLHGLGGILLLMAIVLITVWRGLQRYRWRKNSSKQVHWSYLMVGIIMYILLFIHGTLGAQLGDDFGLHNTATHLVQTGKNPNEFLKSGLVN